MAETRLSDDEAREIVDTALGTAVPGDGLDRVDVRSGFDHDGDPALFVTAYFRAGGAPIEADVFMRAHRSINDALQAAGDNRFPYLRLSRPDWKAS